MDQKKSKRKIPVTSEKHATINAKSGPIVIQSRAIIKNESTTPIENQPPQTIVSRVVSRTIEPISETATPAKAKPVSPQKPAVASPKAPEPISTPEPPAAPDDETIGQNTIQDDSEQLKNTAAAIKRERKMQEYIKNREYFVPVSPTARQHSIKMSFGLVLLLAILSVGLIDLLLDTGAILLVQRIPHTHFFSLYNGQ